MVVFERYIAWYRMELNSLWRRLSQSCWQWRQYQHVQCCVCVGGGGAIRHTYSNNKGERDKKIMGIETNKSKEQTFFLLFFLFFSVKYNYARSMVRRFTKSIDY
jgi:homoserine trans-succinylase